MSRGKGRPTNDDRAARNKSIDDRSRLAKKRRLLIQLYQALDRTEKVISANISYVHSERNQSFLDAARNASRISCGTTSSGTPMS